MVFLNKTSRVKFHSRLCADAFWIYELSWKLTQLSDRAQPDRTIVIVPKVGLEPTRL